MPEEDLPGSITRALSVAVVLATAMASSVIIYLVIAAFLVSQNRGAPLGHATMPALLPPVLSVVAVMMLVAAEVLYRIQLRQLRERTEPADPDQVLTAYRQTLLVSLALRESTAVFGLVLTLLSGNLWWCAVFAAVSLAAMALIWPTRRLMEELVGSDTPPISPT
ncbi:MAG: hypothetical protein LJE95_09390 [Acidobacteria bacterium]|jgi:hypothetical protein|nr:hypothetical protein [Acidobacteriota bacterium]